MEIVDETKLTADLMYRFGFLCKFVGFDDTDIKTIKSCKDAVAPLVPTVVDAVYEKLFSFDSTKRYFATRNEGFEGHVDTDLKKVTHTSEQIKFRKDMLSRYLVKLVTAEYDEKFVKYLNYVGVIHTDKVGKRSINVRYVYMNALLGYVHDILNNAIMDLGLDHDTEKQVIRSFSKLLWIQNDLISRHYIPGESPVFPKEEKKVESFPVGYVGAALAVGAALGAALLNWNKNQ